MSQDSRDIRAAVLGVVYLALLIILAIALFRFVVPAIIETHFEGSLVVAVLVGIAGSAAIVVLGWRMVGHIAGLLRPGG